jgi:membrane-associated protein
MNSFHWTKLFNPEFYITGVGGVPIGIYIWFVHCFAKKQAYLQVSFQVTDLFLSGYTRELVETFFLYSR